MLQLMVIYQFSIHLRKLNHPTLCFVECYFELPDQDDFKVKQGEALRFPCSPGSGSVDYVCETDGLIQRNTGCSGQNMVVIGKVYLVVYN